MKIVINGVVLTMLTVETVSDIRRKNISVIRQLIFIILAAAVNLLMYYQSIWSMLGGMGVGAIMFFYAYLTKEGVGYGDCLVFVSIGAYVGFSKNMRLLFISLIIGGIVGIIYALKKKSSLECRIPFLPCILCAFVIIDAIELVNGGRLV